MKHFRKHIFILLLIFVMAIIYSIIAVSSHNHFQTFGWDLGFFDQIIWKASKGDLAAYSTLAKENLLADHLQAVLYLLAPLYLIKSDVRTLLISQAFLVCFSAYPLFLIAKNISKSFIFSFGIILSYLLFAGTQWTILNEFHQAAFAPLFAALVFYSLHFKRKWLYWMSIAGLLLTKEEYGLLVAALGILIWCVYRTKIKAAATLGLGIFTFFFYVYKLAPFLSANGVYIHFDFGEAGYTPMDVVARSVSDPLFFFKSLVYPYIKARTVFESFLSFGFIPLFAPLYLIPVFEHFVSRFIYAGPQFTKWANVNHHAAALGILLAMASIFACANIYKIIRRSTKIKAGRCFLYCGIYLVVTALFQNVLLHGPINSIFKPQLYATSSWMDDNYYLLEKIPDKAPLAAQNSLLPHLSQREKIYLLPEINDAQYIVFDFHDGPNKYSPLNLGEMKILMESLLKEGSFAVKEQKNEAIMLHRVNK